MFQQIRNAHEFVTAALCTALILAACGVTEPDDADINDSGTVRFVDVEGGCWVIDTESERLEPINLDSRFRVDGLFVVFSANRRTDLATICQVGRIVEIVSMVAPSD